jgi:hypothetical protein
MGIMSKQGLISDDQYVTSIDVMAPLSGTTVTLRTFLTSFFRENSR